ncbi:hypothetical protein N0V83_002339 [Neocucurbitaria cava]|uniref:Ankyrin repeat protein n=1 Tax=Neocucurbitaria cava TaxID=798079 RepID=A0A9W8YG47_9PLEO|nr:hypothetical protein N0V83_002339 [Neocucurbitaria cava]
MPQHTPQITTLEQSPSHGHEKHTFEVELTPEPDDDELPLQPSQSTVDIEEEKQRRLTIPRLGQNEADRRWYKEEFIRHNKNVTMKNFFAKSVDNALNALSRNYVRATRMHPWEILGRQPLAAYQGESNTALLQKHLDQFLEYRMNGLYGAPNDLPNLITRIVDFMASVSDGLSSTTREQWTQAAAHTVSRYCSALTFATEPTPEMKEDLAGIAVDVEALAAAVVLGDQDLYGRLRFPSELLDHAESCEKDEYRDVFLGAWGRFEHNSMSLSDRKSESLKEIISLFLEKGDFERDTINAGQLKNGSFDSIHKIRKRSLLHIAVWRSDLDLVHAVLDAGARPDGVRMEGGELTYPLISAARGGQMDVVRVLMARGADPEAGDRETRGKRTTLAGLKKGSEMYREISKAISEKHRPKKPWLAGDEV